MPTYALHNANGYLKDMFVAKDKAYFLQTIDVSDARQFDTQADAIAYAEAIPTHHTLVVKEI